MNDISVNWESECKMLKEELKMMEAKHCEEVRCLQKEIESLKYRLNEFSADNARLEGQMEVVRLIFGN